MASLGIGIIGCGARLQHLVRLLLAQSPQIEVRGLCDPRPQAIAAMQAIAGTQARVYSDHRELTRAGDIDWVLVGSWNCFHKDHAVAALDAGKHVFCEKPLATTLADVIAMRDAHERSARRFVIGFTLRYSPHYRKLQQLLREGVVGKLVSFEFNETLGFNHGGFIHRDWRRLTRNAGSHVLEKCSHDIDIANWLTGSLASRVASFGGADFFVPANAHHVDRIGRDPAGEARAYYGWPAPVEEDPFRADKDIVDNQVAIIQYASGVRASFHTNCNAGAPERRFHILGTEGSIRADVISSQIEVSRIGWHEHPIIHRTTAGGHGGGDEVLTRELSACMLGGEAPATTLCDGLTAAVTCFALDQAVREQQVVDLAPFWKQAGISLSN